ncbi:hypothetical protein EST38_g11302 [Candolleomyces aberdarensis]|uniref:Uncharacterized protein n=1 Tax=Candolleomyces aberdarensis TaxID=2316362 RepID=A0A4Q2D555_9AGAR|nr:hypothetical protein EST38_g11302 [Candolleomyces aberdarensis]
MPKIRPGWTPKQSVYLRIAAIEFLRTSLAGHKGNEYLNAFFEEWVGAYGNPTVPEGSSLEDTMKLYRTMAPPSWADEAQTGLLNSYLPLYETYHASTRRYQPFWDTIYSAYLQEFPVLAKDVTPESLDEAEFALYSANLARLYARIKEWYRWRTNSRSQKTSNTVTSKEMKDIYALGTRSAKEYEVFVKEHPDVFLPIYEAECVRQGAEGRARLSIWHRIAKEQWLQATEGQKASVQARLTAAKEASMAEEPNASTPADYQKYVYIILAIFRSNSSQAGVLAFVTLVGPVPKAGGQILATTLQFGDKPETPLFSTTWVDHDRILVDQLANFAGRYEFRMFISDLPNPHLLPMQSLSSGTLCQAFSSADTEDQGGTIQLNLRLRHGGGISHVVRYGGGTGHVLGYGGGTGHVLRYDETVPPESSGPTLTDPANAQPQSEASSPLMAPQSLGIVAPTTTSSNDNVGGNLDPFDLSRFDDNWFDNPAWANPDIFNKIMSSNASDVEDSLATHLECFPVGLTALPNINAPVFGTHELGTPLTSTPAPSAPTTTHAPAIPLYSALVPNVTATAPLTNQGSAVAPAAVTASLFINRPTLPAIVPAKDAFEPALKTAPHAISPLASNVGLSTPFSFALAAGRFNRQPNVETSRGFVGNKENAAPDGQTSSPRAPATTASTALQDADPQNGTRRSRRAPVPSTRIDKLNAIGTNVIPPKPAIIPVSGTEEPFWFAPAYEYLKKSTLGVAWVELVENWAEYERVKGWKSGKGLPAKGRPEEWQKWISKARHGIRNYDNIPNIEDAADLGIAVQTWVRSFTNPDFGRTGPHGMVVWSALLQDLLVRFNQLNPNLGTKRAREDNTLDLDEAHGNKCSQADPTT